MILTNLLSRIFTRPGATAGGAAAQELARAHRLMEAGDLSAAEEACRNSLRIDGELAPAHCLLGVMLGQRGATAEAAEHLDRALEFDPADSGAHAARGNLFLLGDRYANAIACYERALSIDPSNALALFNLGLAAQAQADVPRALNAFSRAFEIAPDIPDLLKNLTLCLMELDRHAEARTLLEHILARTPQHYEANRCLGLVLQKLHLPREALVCYERIIHTAASDPELLNNLAIVLQDLGRLDDAIERYDRAIALKPDFPLAIWHRSLAYLMQHQFARGWTDYELRTLNVELPRRARTFPRWQGEPLADKTLLVYAEQGLGDEIMFSSCIPDLLAAGGRVIIECSAKLEPVFRRSFAPARVYAFNDARALPAELEREGIDFELPIGSLPLHFRSELAQFPPHNGYLKADPVRVAAWRERLAARGPGLKVGIAWQGGTRRSRKVVRSLALEQLQPVLETRDVHFVDLQYTDCSAEIAAFRAASGIAIESRDEIRSDYEETVALVAALDLVISVCTAVIHLGGALGKRVWVMAPFSPEWRYGISGERMPWYPAVRVLRQPAYGHWEPVIAEVARNLQQLRDQSCSAD